MTVNLEQIAGIVIAGALLQGGATVVAMLVFRAESKARARADGLLLAEIRRALGLDGTESAAFVRRDEFVAEVDRTREKLEEHGNAIEHLRRAAHH